MPSVSPWLASRPRPRLTRGGSPGKLAAVPPTIGILGTRTTREVQRVRDELRRRGARVLVAELHAFPSLHRGALEPCTLRVGSTDLAAAPVWLLRQLDVSTRLDPAARPADIAALAGHLDEALVDDREVRCWVESLARSLSDPAGTRTRVVNDFDSTRFHARKPLLVARLHRAGIPVPASLATNDRAAAERFVERWHGEAICKSAAGGGEVRLARDLLAGLHPAADSWPGPYLFQQRIRGTSLRAYVVGEAGPELFLPGQSGTVLPAGTWNQGDTYYQLFINSSGGQENVINDFNLLKAWAGA